MIYLVIIVLHFSLRSPMQIPFPTPISQQLLELLLDQRADWILPHWKLAVKRYFSAGFSPIYPENLKCSHETLSHILRQL